MYATGRSTETEAEAEAEAEVVDQAARGIPLCADSPRSANRLFQDNATENRIGFSSFNRKLNT